jgi:hypothetical protein
MYGVLLCKADWIGALDSSKQVDSFLNRNKKRQPYLIKVGVLISDGKY